MYKFIKPFEKNIQTITRETIIVERLSDSLRNVMKSSEVRLNHSDESYYYKRRGPEPEMNEEQSHATPIAQILMEDIPELLQARSSPSKHRVKYH